MTLLKIATLCIISLLHLLLSESYASSDRLSLALCLFTKDQCEDIREWVEYHFSIGVTNIIILDDNSSTPCLHEIQDYLHSGFISHYIFFNHDGGNKHQYSYNLCLRNFRPKYSHIGFIDIDEFIVIKNKSKSIIDLLEPYKSYPGLTLNSMFFGSSGHMKRPAGGVLKNYNKCTKDSHVKVIVNTQLTIRNYGPHTFKHKQGDYPVDTNFKAVESPWNPSADKVPADSLFEVAYLNHYVLKSYEEFKLMHKRRFRELNFFDETDKRMTSECELLSPRSTRL